jgi:hypothetical protein
VPEASAERLGIGGKREAPPQKAKQTRAICSRAQQPAMPVIGVLYGVSAAEWAELMTGFRRGLSEMGFVECRNIAIEYRWAEVGSIGCRRWRPILSAAKSRSS